MVEKKEQTLTQCETMRLITTATDESRSQPRIPIRTYSPGITKSSVVIPQAQDLRRDGQNGSHEEFFELAKRKAKSLDFAGCKLIYHKYCSVLR